MGIATEVPVGSLFTLMGLEEATAAPAPQWPGAAEKVARLRPAVPYLYDPRPTLGDTALWQRLLAAAFLADGEAAEGLYGALHGLRCLGARLVRRENGRYRLIGQEGEYRGEWDADARDWLAPHRAALTALLRELEAGQEAQGDNDDGHRATGARAHPTGAAAGGAGGAGGTGVSTGVDDPLAHVPDGDGPGAADWLRELGIAGSTRTR